MKTKQLKNQKSGLLSRPDEQSSKAENNNTPSKPIRVLPFVNRAERESSRALSTERVLAALRRWMPHQYELAEVVGQWIWITFPEPPPEQVRAELSQFGFHWNSYRKCWQHPCGQFASEGSGADPRLKYGSHFVADHVAA
jgi:hypothetical protein